MPTTIEDLLPQVLAHVDRDRGWMRKAALLELIARNTLPGHPVALGIESLRSFGRTDAQARYDHGRLVELAGARVLLRWEGRGTQGDAWALNPAVEQWRHVPWLSPRPRWWNDLKPSLSRGPASLLAKSPGQRVLLWGVGGVLDDLDELLTRTFTPSDRATMTRDHATMTRGDREVAGQGVSPDLGSRDNDAATSDPSLRFLELTPPSLPSLPDDNSAAEPKGGREGGNQRSEDDDDRGDGLERFKRRLEDVLSVTAMQRTGRPVEIRGKAAEARARRIVDRWGDHIDALVAACDRFAGWFSLTVALDYFETEWSPGVDHAAPTGTDVQAKIDLRRLWIARLEPLDPESPHLAVYRAEIEELEAALAGRAAPR